MTIRIKLKFTAKIKEEKGSLNKNYISVTRYVEWSYHEPEERQYIFEGDHDIVKYIETAAEEGLHVILRVGPYICAERDLASTRNSLSN